MNARINGIMKSLGPGLLFAGAAVGVSHLVQSTRAGANYGFALIWVIIIANVLKYPFFEFGPRYAAATGNNLLQGYMNIGRWALLLFLAMTIGTMFVIQAAVTLVTAAVATQLFPFSLSILTWSAILLSLSIVIAFVGRYALLDRLMKVIIVILSISTFIAFVMALFAGPPSAQKAAVAASKVPGLWSLGGIAFLMALIGWMPTPVECATWHSIWTIERKKQTGHNPTVKEALFDFNVGYIGTALLAFAFLGLGAMVMHGTGKTFSPSAATFAGQVIKLYTDTLGQWSFFLIATAAFCTMVSTTLTVIDTYPRVLKHAFTLLMPEQKDHEEHVYWGSFFVLAAGSLLIISMFLKSFKYMIDFATILSFVTAPVFAYINYRVITDKHVPEEARPSPKLRALSWLGLFFLTGFTLAYIGWRVWRAVS